MPPHSDLPSRSETGDVMGHGPRWWPDADLDASTRDYLAELLTPRRGLDDRLYWPCDELEDADA
jgi:hypothetical protein